MDAQSRCLAPALQQLLSIRRIVLLNSVEPLIRMAAAMGRETGRVFRDMRKAQDASRRGISYKPSAMPGMIGSVYKEYIPLERKCKLVGVGSTRLMVWVFETRWCSVVLRVCRGLGIRFHEPARRARERHSTFSIEATQGASRIHFQPQSYYAASFS